MRFINCDLNIEERTSARKIIFFSYLKTCTIALSVIEMCFVDWYFENIE